MTDQINEMIEEIEVQNEDPEYKVGKVICDRLNVRSEPSVTSEIITTFKKNQEMLIDDVNSTKEFYSIFTESGIEGYCMKQFIAVE